jgi:hypothetical protein
MRIPESIVSSAECEGDKLVDGRILGCMVYDESEVTIDTTDAGAVVHIFDFGGIVGSRIETCVHILGQILRDVFALKAPIHNPMAVMNLPEGWAAIHTGDDLPPRLIMGLDTLLGLYRRDIVVGEGFEEKGDPSQKPAQHDECVSGPAGGPLVESGEVPRSSGKTISHLFPNTS